MSAVLKSLQRDELIMIAVEKGKKLTGSEWSRGMKSRGTEVCTKARRILLSLEEPIGVNVGKTLGIFRPICLKDEDRTTQKIYVEMNRRGLRQASPGAVCLLEENLSDADLEEMGFWWLVGMHKPITFKKDAYLLSFGRSDLHRSFNVCRYNPEHKWRAHNGFICEVP